MKTYTAELTPCGSHWILHTCFTRAGQPVMSEGWTRHPSVEDARAFLDDLCLRLGATLDRVVVVTGDGTPGWEQDDALASVGWALALRRSAAHEAWQPDPRDQRTVAGRPA